MDNKRIKNAANKILEMDKRVREEFIEKNEEEKLWEKWLIKRQIDKRNLGGSFDIKDHIRGMVYSMLSANSQWCRLEGSTDPDTGYIPKIDEIFFNYDVEKILSKDVCYYCVEIKNIKCGNPRIEYQLKALLNKNIPKLQAYEKEYGSVDALYKRFSDVKTLVKALSSGKYKFAEMAEALNAEYLRNVGYDIIKPDRHVRKAFGINCLACSDREVATVNEVFEIAPKIAKAANKSQAEIDYIIWNYSRLNNGAAK